MASIKEKYIIGKVRFGYIAVFAVLCIALIMLAFYVYNSQRDKYRRESAQVLMGISRLKANQISQWLFERKSDSYAICKNRNVTDLIKNVVKGKPGSKASTEWLMTVADLYGFKDIYIISKYLKIFDVNGKQVKLTFENEITEKVNSSFNTKQWDIFYSKSAQSKLLDLSGIVPVLDTDNSTVVGVLLLQIDPDVFLYPYLSRWPTENQFGDNMLEDKNGKIFFSSNRDYEKDRFNKDFFDFNVSLTEGESTGYCYDKYDNKYIFAYSAVETSKWVIRSQRKVVDIERPLTRFTIYLLSIIVAMIICAASVIILLWNKEERKYLLKELDSVTDKEQIRQAMNIMESRFQSTFEFAEIGLAHLRLDGLFIRVNQYFCDFIGHTRDELMQMSFQQITHPDDIESSNKLVHNLLKGTIPSFSTDKRYLKPDGTFVWAGVTVTIMRSNRDEEPYFIVAITDISVRKKLVEELERKNRELSQVIYVASHDLRSPLVNILGFSRELEYSLTNIIELISDKSSGNHDTISKIIDEDISESLNYIKVSTSHMDRLLAGLLKVSRTGNMPIIITNVNVNDIVIEAISNLEYLIKEKNAEITTEPLPPCSGDNSLVSQVFNNLLLNALKYLDNTRPGIIRISGYTTEFESVYVISDNGIGIAEIYHDKIFELFHRLNPRDSDGDGLGLTIVKTILERLNGKIWLHSAPGQGSEFYVSLPVIKENGDNND